MTPSDVAASFPNVSRETFEALKGYAALLIKWNRTINLVAPGTIPDLWGRHICDSLQLLGHIPPNANRLLDIGSGAGFPGLVLAIAMRNLPQAPHVILLDSDTRKCEFLRTASREAGVAPTIMINRVEDASPLGCDVLTARAVAPLIALLGHANRHLVPGGTALFLKGGAISEELADARLQWRFTHERHSSLTNPEAEILKIGEIDRV